MHLIKVSVAILGALSIGVLAHPLAVPRVLEAREPQRESKVKYRRYEPSVEKREASPEPQRESKVKYLRYAPSPEDD